MLLIQTQKTIPHDIQKRVTNDAKLPNLLIDSDLMTSLAEVNFDRRIKLSDATVYTTTKDGLNKLCNEYRDIFSNPLT